MKLVRQLEAIMARDDRNPAADMVVAQTEAHAKVRQRKIDKIQAENEVCGCCCASLL